MTSPASRILTDRTVLRRWRPDDAPLFKAALDASLDTLHPWVPWARTEPYSLEFVRGRIALRVADFEEGAAFEYGIFDPEEAEVMGGAGLYARVGPEALELGYWIRADQAGRGLATEVARTLTNVAFDSCGAASVEMHIDPRNVASLRIPEKLGFRFRDTIVEEGAGIAVYRLKREEYEEAPSR